METLHSNIRYEKRIQEIKEILKYCRTFDSTVFWRDRLTHFETLLESVNQES